MNETSEPGIELSAGVTLRPQEWSWTAVRAQGAGGQNVNKVASAVHLRFDIDASSLPEDWKARLRASRDRRITADGVLVIKAQRFRQQEKNRADAIARLKTFLLAHEKADPPRKPTRPSRAARQRRLDAKTRRGALKKLRRHVDD